MDRRVLHSESCPHILKSLSCTENKRTSHLHRHHYVVSYPPLCRHVCELIRVCSSVKFHESQRHTNTCVLLAVSVRVCVSGMSKLCNIFEMYCVFCVLCVMVRNLIFAFCTVCLHLSFGKSVQVQ